MECMTGEKQRKILQRGRDDYYIIIAVNPFKVEGFRP